jgi:Kef-type K+ transport system membrane component KefB
MVLDSSLAWPFCLLLAWIAGEWLSHVRLPRIITYSLCGLACGPALGWLAVKDLPQGRLLADAAMGLLLFEIGYRLNPMWMVRNHWVLITSLIESSLTFLAVFACCMAFDFYWVQATMLASLCMATSPAAVLRVTRDAQSSGQVTNLVLTLSAMNCFFSILAFNAATGVAMQTVSLSAAAAPGTVLMIVSASMALACLGALLFSMVLRLCSLPNESIPFTIALFVACMTVLIDALRLSPALAMLCLGVAFRFLKIKITGRYQDFGSLGRFFTLFLFVFISAAIDLEVAWSGLGFGLLIVLVRGAIKIGVCAYFATLLGTSRRKGALAGLALMPVSAFALMLLEQARHLGINILGSFPPVVAIALLLEILGPIATRVAITQSAENND